MELKGGPGYCYRALGSPYGAIGSRYGPSVPLTEALLIVELLVRARVLIGIGPGGASKNIKGREETIN